MTNYLTAVGVQQVSITIASGATSNTAAISQVGTGAFIVFQGVNSSDTANLGDSNARIELTNTTTITAFRSISGTSQTVVVNAVIIDGDATNLIKSVQSGTVTFTTSSTTGTAAINPVTNANTAIFFLGVEGSGSAIGVNDNEFKSIVSLATTTVTVTRNTANLQVPTVGFIVVEFQGTALNSSVQNVAYSASTNATTDTSTISNVTTANTFLAYGGYTQASNNAAQEQPYISLTATNTITYNWATSGTQNRKFNVCVVEFVSGVLAQAIQRGTIALSAATSNTATLTNSSPTASTFINWLGNSSNDTTLNPETSEYKITQTSNTVLTMTAAASATGTGSYEAVQLTPYSAGGTRIFDMMPFF